MNDLTVLDINSDEHLSVIIAATFAIAVSHLHSLPVLNGYLAKSLQWKHYSYEELEANSGLAWKVAYNAAETLKTFHAIFSAKYASSIPRFAHTNHDAEYRDYLMHATSSADKSSEKADFTHNNLRLLLPLILNYKLNKSKRPFNSPEKILNLLEDEDRQQFLFNLDVL